MQARDDGDDVDLLAGITSEAIEVAAAGGADGGAGWAAGASARRLDDNEEGGMSAKRARQFS